MEVKGLVNLSSNAGTGFYNFLNANTRLDIVVTDASLNLNSNENGFFAYLEASTDLNVFVEEGGSFTSCLNTVSDIKQTIPLSSTGAGVRFLVDGDGEYTCDQSKVEGTFVVTPVCQACPLGFVGFLE